MQPAGRPGHPPPPGRLEREIRLLRSLTGFPAKKKYGGQGGGSGSGTGGSGAGALGLPGAPGSGLGSPGGGAAWSITPGPAGGPTAGTPAAGSAPGGMDALLGRIDLLLAKTDQVIQATRSAPALTGAHLGTALNGVSRSAQSSARWNTR